VVECVLENLEALTIPYSFGSFSWTLQDYLGETGGFGWPDVSSHYGLFDLAGFPKDTIGAYTAWWRDPAGGCAAVSLAPTDWTAPVAPGDNLTVYAFTCAPTAELFVNGVSQGAVAVPPQGAAQWPNTAFVPGNLTAVAYGAGGQALARASVLTAGAPAALRLWVEGGYLPPRNASVIAAAGGDVALLGVQVLDAAGLPVPVGAANVSFTVAGPGAVVGVHNGDPADHSPTRAAWRLTFHGKARAILASTGAQGELTVTASAPGLAPASVQLLAQ
jgi:beta-galactosidase